MSRRAPELETVLLSQKCAPEYCHNHKKPLQKTHKIRGTRFQNMHNSLVSWEQGARGVPARVWHPGPGNSRSREFFNFFDGIGTGIEKIWYRKKSRNRSRKKLVPKKVSEPVSEKLGTEKSLGIGLKKIWYRKKISEPVLKFFRLFVLIWVPVSSRSRDFCTFLDGIGTGLEKIWYRKKSRNRSRKKWVPKKVSESVSKNFGTEKSLGIGLEKIWYRKKSLGIGIVQILGLVTHCNTGGGSNPVIKKFRYRKKSWNRYRSDFGSRHTLQQSSKYLQHHMYLQCFKFLLRRKYLLRVTS